jgi:type I restriction enzyme S subunit
MKYQTYPAYKDSEIEWVDFLPDHWGKVKLRLQAELYAGGTPSKNIEEYWEDGTVPWINSGAVNQITVTEPSMYITEQAFRNSSAKWIPKNALVMALAGQGKTKGMVAKLAINTTCNQSMAAIVPKKSSNSNYLFWWLTFNYQNIRNMAGGDLRDGLNLELLGNIECPTPTNEEKISIAQFLDHETAKIDTLIEKQQRLIELLKEKRQAVISHAVTKGLNPNAPMKESGVEWLGDVPEHWEVIQSRRLFFQRKERARPDDEQLTASQKHGVIFQKEYMELENQRVVQVITGSEILKHVEPNDFVISMRSFQGGLEWCKYAGSVSSAYIGLIAIKHVVPEFFAYLFKSNPYIQALQSTSNLVRDGQALRFENFSQVNLLKIPDDEQILIADFLNQETNKIDVLILKAQKGIELMQERRTALISAAVTGKIDVRHWGD